MKSVEKKEGQFNFRCLQWTLYGYEQYEKEDRYVTRHPDSLSPNLPLYLMFTLYPNQAGFWKYIWFELTSFYLEYSCFYFVIVLDIYW